jgi:hypothetical protein
MKSWNHKFIAPWSMDRIATTEVRLEGFYWVIRGQPPGDRLLGAR